MNFYDFDPCINNLADWERKYGSCFVIYKGEVVYINSLEMMFKTGDRKLINDKDPADFKRWWPKAGFYFDGDNGSFLVQRYPVRGAKRSACFSGGEANYALAAAEDSGWTDKRWMHGEGWRGAVFSLATQEPSRTMRECLSILSSGFSSAPLTRELLLVDSGPNTKLINSVEGLVGIVDVRSQTIFHGNTHLSFLNKHSDAWKLKHSKIL